MEINARAMKYVLRILTHGELNFTSTEFSVIEVSILNEMVNQENLFLQIYTSNPLNRRTKNSLTGTIIVSKVTALSQCTPVIAWS